MLLHLMLMQQNTLLSRELKWIIRKKVLNEMILFCSSLNNIVMINHWNYPVKLNQSRLFSMDEGNCFQRKLMSTKFSFQESRD